MPPRRGSRFARSGRPQLVLSTRQLATLVKAGMPLLRALRTVTDLPSAAAVCGYFISAATDAGALTP